MRIKNDNEATERLHDERYMPPDYSVKFNEADSEGRRTVANVREDVAQELVAAEDLPTISEHASDDAGP